MNNSCPFCNSTHIKILEGFSDISFQNSFEKYDLEKFIDKIQTNVLQGNWLAVSCLLESILMKKNWKLCYGHGSFLFWEYCQKCQILLKSEPKISSLENIKKFILQKFDKLDMKNTGNNSPGIHKVRNTDEIPWDHEINILKFLAENLDKIDENASELKLEYFKDKNKPDVNQDMLNNCYKNSLTNYIFYRLHSIYENRMNHILTGLINKMPHSNFKTIMGNEIKFNTDDMPNIKNISQGQLAVLSVKTNFWGYDQVINNILKSFGTPTFTIHYKASFSKFFQKIIYPKFSNTKYDKFLSQKRFDHKWENLLTHYQKKRNDVTHNLDSYEDSSDDLINFLDLLKFYLISLEDTLDLIFDYASSNYVNKKPESVIREKIRILRLRLIHDDFVQKFYSEFDYVFKDKSKNKN